MNALNNTYGVYVSPTEFWIQNIVFYVFSSVVGVSMNILLFIVIFMERKTRLKSSFYILISIYSTFKSVVCLSLIIFGVYQIWGYYYPNILIVSRVSCIVILEPVIVGEYFMSTIMLMISFDRFIAIMLFKQYKKLMTPILICTVCSGLFIITVLIMVVGLIKELSLENNLLLCINPLTYVLTLYSAMVGAGQILFGMCSVLIYGAITVIYSYFLFSVIKKF